MESIIIEEEFNVKKNIALTEKYLNELNEFILFNKIYDIFNLFKNTLFGLEIFINNINDNNIDDEEKIRLLKISLKLFIKYFQYFNIDNIIDEGIANLLINIYKNIKQLRTLVLFSFSYIFNFPFYIKNNESIVPKLKKQKFVKIFLKFYDTVKNTTNFLDVFILHIFEKCIINFFCFILDDIVQDLSILSIINFNESKNIIFDSIRFLMYYTENEKSNINSVLFNFWRLFLSKIKKNNNHFFDGIIDDLRELFFNIFPAPYDFELNNSNCLKEILIDLALLDQTKSKSLLKKKLNTSIKESTPNHFNSISTTIGIVSDYFHINNKSELLQYTFATLIAFIYDIKKNQKDKELVIYNLLFIIKNSTSYLNDNYDVFSNLINKFKDFLSMNNISLNVFDSLCDCFKIFSIKCTKLFLIKNKSNKGNPIIINLLNNYESLIKNLNNFQKIIFMDALSIIIAKEGDNFTKNNYLNSLLVFPNRLFGELNNQARMNNKSLKQQNLIDVVKFIININIVICNNLKLNYLSYGQNVINTIYYLMEYYFVVINNENNNINNKNNAEAHNSNLFNEYLFIFNLILKYFNSIIINISDDSTIIFVYEKVVSNSGFYLKQIKDVNIKLNLLSLLKNMLIYSGKILIKKYSKNTIFKLYYSLFDSIAVENNKQINLKYFESIKILFEILETSDE